MGTDDFDLNHLITAELEASKIADPHVVADQIMKRLRSEFADHVWDALETCLPQRVRQVASSSRVASFAPLPSTEPSQKGKRPRSARVEGQAWARRLLSQRLAVGDADREWRMLGDCTIEDLEQAVAFRERLAAANMASADRYRQLIKAMRERKAQRVSDVPAEVLFEIMGPAAA